MPENHGAKCHLSKAAKELIMKTQSLVPSQKALCALVFEQLQKQGFNWSDGCLTPPENKGKEDIRRRHQQAVEHNRAKARKVMEKHEESLLARIANGVEVVPGQITPAIVEVKSRSPDELLFRYAALHWSIPISSGYGRRLRFLVVDQSNEKLIGIIGLGDPVFSLKARDEWVGWDHETRRHKLRHVMEAFVLGAVPPYSYLLCGKLVALLAASNEVRHAFRKKYGKRHAAISHRPGDGRLALITTSSALGRSSIYNRLRYHGETVFNSVGYTSGWGEIYFSNGLYAPLQAYAEANLNPTARHADWGTGFRNRQEVIRKCLQDLGLSQKIRRHQIMREVFAVPLAKNARKFLSGENTRLYRCDRSASELSHWFLDRWLLPRAQRDIKYLEWSRDDWRLWGE
ncbi:MAG: DUF4338 domain-containing protein [Gammaproteobacteria bacterium]|nr:DUF4338 domain-containing protein [Gammaproteobacteria bacterium]